MQLFLINLTHFGHSQQAYTTMYTEQMYRKYPSTLCIHSSLTDKCTCTSSLSAQIAWQPSPTNIRQVYVYHRRYALPPYSVFGFIEIVDSLERDDLWGIVVAQSAENDTIPQCLLKLCGRRNLIFNTGFNPPGERERERERDREREREREREKFNTNKS